jgi:ribokinase
MTRDLDVLVVGDANPDLILRGDVVPRFSQSEQLLDSADLTLGGSGAIVAHGTARLGLRTMLAAVIGDDPFGALTRQYLADASVDVSELRVDPDHPTGLSVVLTQGESRSTLTLIGAIGLLDPASVPDDLLRRTHHLHAASFYLQPAFQTGLAGLFARARAVGTSTSLDTNLDPADRWDGLDEVLPLTDVLLPNRTEILGMARRYGAADALDVVAAARTIAAFGPLVVVKDGERGAVAVDRHGEVTIQSGDPVTAIDSTGAGDSFDAAFLAARAAGRALPDCLAQACRAGALSTLGIGGTSNQATAAQLQLTDHSG